MARSKPTGFVTRGTTNPNRLRRVDRFIAALPLVRKTNAIVVDLGFGASAITAIELLNRLSRVNSSLHVVGVEIQRERVERAEAFANERLHFVHGGFETPLPDGLGAQKASVIRAFNVLRQYDESEVLAAWKLMQGRLTDDGLLIEGTCDEIGRLSCWITLDCEKPLSLTISLRLRGLELPSKVAERLPKILIHKNVDGENIHGFLAAIDAAWIRHAPLAVFGASQRWIAVCKDLRNAGWPLVGDTKRWRLGELSVDWSAVEPSRSN